MTDGAALNAAAAAILLAFGITMPMPAFSGGMLLALGSCYAVRAYRSVDGRRGLGLSLFSAIIAAMIVAAMHEITNKVWVWGSLPLQMQMAAGGAFSQAVFELVAARDTKFVAWIADKAGLSKGDK